MARQRHDGMLVEVPTTEQARAPRDEVHGRWPCRNVIALCYAAFTIYAGALAIFSVGEDRTWAVWGFSCYLLAALALRFSKHWWPGLAVALGGGLIAPFIWLATQAQATAEVTVISRSAVHLLHYGTPYLPVSQLTAWTDYNPYLPVMEAFGLPHALGLGGWLGDPRAWTSLATVVLIAAALAVASPHRLRSCPSCRQRAARLTVAAIASPVIAFPLALGITDPPIIALTCLALACAARGWLRRAAIVIAVACAMKYTAWPVVPVLAVMAWSRHSARAAARFTAVSVGGAAVLALATAPAALSQLDSLLQNTIAFPLGLTRAKTPAASPLPGHMLAQLGAGGHAVAVALMAVAAVVIAAWVIKRPPASAQAVAWRLAVGYAVLFLLAPATRFGYFAYPLAMFGWLALIRPVSAAEARAALARWRQLLPGARYEPERQEAR